MMGLGVANAAKHKLVGLLAKKLEADGIYVAETYWDLYTARKDLRATLR
jgi:hypothetical protein